MQRTRRHQDRINLVRGKPPGELQLVTIRVHTHRQIIDRRRNPQHVPCLDDPQSLRRRGKLQCHPSRLRRVRRAAPHHVIHRRVVITIRAIGIPQLEGQGALQRQIEHRVIQPRLVRQAQPQRRDLSIRHRLMQRHQDRLLVPAPGPLHRPQREILRRQHLRRLRPRDPPAASG